MEETVSQRLLRSRQLCEVNPARYPDDFTDWLCLVEFAEEAAPDSVLRAAFSITIDSNTDVTDEQLPLCIAELKQLKPKVSGSEGWASWEKLARWLKAMRWLVEREEES